MHAADSTDYSGRPRAMTTEAARRDAPPSGPALRVDVVCRVIDFLGDAGVCWRLARQLADEHGCRVRLWIDRPDLIERLAPGGYAGTETLPLERLPRDFAPGDAVITAFDSELPAEAVARIATSPSDTVRIHIEYLSAEPWIDGCHGLVSLKADGTRSWFFFPGFTPDSGGLQRERELEARRLAFQGVPRERWRAGAGAAAGELVYFLFAYDDPPIAEWLDLLRAGDRPVTVLGAAGVGRAAVEAVLGRYPQAGCPVTSGALRFASMPFVPQIEFDAILWASDFAFVRGEDSWIRAHWARIPFIWAPYRQASGWHLRKLDAFLARMLDGADDAAAEAVRALAHAWSGVGPITEAWTRYQAQLPAIRALHEQWARTLAARPDMASEIVRMVHSKMLKSPVRQPPPGC